MKHSIRKTLAVALFLASFVTIAVAQIPQPTPGPPGPPSP